MLWRIHDHTVWLSHCFAFGALQGASSGTFVAIRSRRAIAWPTSAITCGRSFGIVPV